MRGKEGIGKGTIAKIIKRIIGRHYVHLSSPKQLTGNHNAHLMYAMIAFLDEAFFAGDKSADGVLKAMVTEETRMIEPKFVDAFEIKNYLRILMATNNDWVVPAGPTARRYVVLDVSDKHENEVEYWDPLNDDIDNNGAVEAWAWHLVNEVNIDQKALAERGINLRKAPQTSALVEQKVKTLTGMQAFWLDLTMQGGSAFQGGRWPDLIPKDALYNLYQRHVAQAKELHPMTFAVFGKALKSVADVKSIRPRLDGVNRPMCYVLPSLGHCREHLAKVMGTTAAVLYADDAEDDPFHN